MEKVAIVKRKHRKTFKGVVVSTKMNKTLSQELIYVQY